MHWVPGAEAFTNQRNTTACCRRHRPWISTQLETHFISVKFMLIIPDFWFTSYFLCVWFLLLTDLRWCVHVWNLLPIIKPARVWITLCCFSAVSQYKLSTYSLSVAIMFLHICLTYINPSLPVGKAWRKEPWGNGLHSTLRTEHWGFANQLAFGSHQLVWHHFQCGFSGPHVVFLIQIKHLICIAFKLDVGFAMPIMLIDFPGSILISMHWFLEW